MSNIPVIQVGTGNETKVITPALLTAIGPDGAPVALKANSSGQILTSGTGGAPSAHASSHLPGGSDAISGIVTITGPAPAVGDTLVRKVVPVGEGFANEGTEQWMTQQGLIDTNEATVMDWTGGTRNVYDGSGLLSSDFSNRILYSDIGDSVLNWSGDITLSTPYSGNIVTIGGGVAYMTMFNDAITFSGSVLMSDLNGMPFLEANTDNRLLMDYSGTTAVNFGYRTLLTYGGSYGIDWSIYPVLYSENNAGYSPTCRNLELTKTEAVIASVGCVSFTPSAGGTVTVTSDVCNNLTVGLTHSGTIASATINLVAWAQSAPDGAIITIFARNAITAVTLTTTGFTVYGAALTTLTANQTVEYRKLGTDRSSISGNGTILIRTR